ncbi:receptor homology region, transmembrane domain- and RING domain-containing protein 1-like [Corylus avellana]|uniref:receptor homology region, transmembrane domain- and RING domain-containing protein 1-like n=1 Tax=Corylus avellana TaxID=13451 RepID=UPI00286C856D|nr:receptor homology region, transmembrane domain- and RING domain-containing protein 1-like [Corylus avellana]
MQIHIICSICFFAYAGVQANDDEENKHHHDHDDKWNDSSLWVFAAYMAILIGITLVLFLLLFLWHRFCHVDPVAAMIQRFPVFTFVPGGESGFGATECSICLTEFADGEHLRMLPCGHIYHRQCLRELVASGSMTCPDCRHNFGNNNAWEVR